ncbi:hypothetical protein [Micromonospora sp. NPDC050695]|uniref:hypothetical protein n=1 Tax=Micromonospora sp. NPDC050695 TaxID=3154938 RepID=UPI0033E44C3C
MADISAVDRVRVAHACEDYAGSWACNPATGGSVGSVGRYVAEGNLAKLCDRCGFKTVWAAVRGHLDAHPEILAAGRLTDAQRAERQAGRDADSAALLADAEVPFREGRWDEALALVDRAELASPGHAQFDRYREIVRSKMTDSVAAETT